MDVRIIESPPAIAADASEMFVMLAQQTATEGRVFNVALSGGSTPRMLYGLLASDTFKNEVQWNSIHFFFADERWVAPTSRESNYRLAKDELFSKVDIKPENIFPVPTEGLTPGEAAREYENTIKKVFNLKENEVPRFDLIFLGMGEDGHIASCFPYTEVLNEHKALVAANYVDKLASYRITLTPPVLLAAKHVLFLVTGESKAPALREVLEGEYNPQEYPAQLLRNAQGNVIWLVDRAAASLLKGRYTQG